MDMDVTMTLRELWNLVNSAYTLDQIEQAEQTIVKADIDAYDFDELMNTLAYLKREAYRRKRR